MTMPDKAVTPLLAEFAKRERESRSPVALRDTLLPKLMSGELWVAEAERVVGERV